jgi:hypothetical protein
VILFCDDTSEKKKKSTKSQIKKQQLQLQQSSSLSSQQQQSQSITLATTKYITHRLLQNLQKSFLPFYNEYCQSTLLPATTSTSTTDKLQSSSSSYLPLKIQRLILGYIRILMGMILFTPEIRSTLGDQHVMESILQLTCYDPGKQYEELVYWGLMFVSVSDYYYYYYYYYYCVICSYIIIVNDC